MKIGITLIALIITIIVLVILAAVSISAVYNSNIVNYAVNGATNYASEATRENEILDQTASIIQDAVDKISDIAGGNPGEDPVDPPDETEPGINFGDLSEDEMNAMVGKYVDYLPVSDTFSDHVGSTYSGSNNNAQMSTITTLKWRILDADTNTLTLISDIPANANFTLYGANGYNNGVLLLNNACKAMYSNSNLGATGRSIKIEDIEAISTYDKKSYTFGNYVNGGEFVVYGSNYYPSIFAKEKNGAPNGTYGTTYDLSEQSEYVTGINNTTLELRGKHTMYQYNITGYMSSIYQELISSVSGDYHIASRCAYHDSTGINFCMFLLSMPNSISYMYLYNDNGPSNNSKNIRPVVEIDLSKVNVGVTGDGGVDTPYSIEAK